MSCSSRAQAGLSAAHADDMQTEMLSVQNTICAPLVFADLPLPQTTNIMRAQTAVSVVRIESMLVLSHNMSFVTTD